MEVVLRGTLQFLASQAATACQNLMELARGITLLGLGLLDSCKDR